MLILGRIKFSCKSNFFFFFPPLEYWLNTTWPQLLCAVLRWLVVSRIVLIKIRHFQMTFNCSLYRNPDTMLPHCQGLTGTVFIGCEEENGPRT